jgi:hypothetical protein
MLEAKVRQSGKQHAAGCGACALGQRRHGLRRRVKHQQCLWLRNILAERQIRRRLCPLRPQGRRCSARVRRATLHGHRKLLWWRAIRAGTPHARPPSEAVPTPWWNLATDPILRNP